MINGYQYNAFADDDPVFPSMPVNQKRGGLICENSGGGGQPDGVAAFAAQQLRSQAMSAVLEWAAEGEFTFIALDEFVLGMADLDGDAEISSDEEDVYNDIMRHVPDALLSLGAAPEDISAMINEEDDAAAARVGKTVAASLTEIKADDAEIVAGFAVGQDAILESVAYDEERHMVLEASYKKQKVVRDGKVVIVRRRVSGAVRLSAAQRAALKKARRKANTSAAKLARRKSMKIRARRGL